MASPPIDPRVARTKRALSTALFELVRERRWEQIRVQDILDRSGVSRSAFYAHYDNQFDLLTEAVPGLVVSISRDGDIDLAPLFEHVAQMAGVLRPVLRQPLLAQVSQTFHRSLAAAFADACGADGAAEPARLRADFLAGAVVAAVRTYLEQAASEGRDPAEAAAEVTAYVRAVLDC